MKAAAVILILAIVVLGSLSMTSCLVDRHSEEFVCTVDGDCHDGRTCSNGYCVQGACPSACTSCDLANKTCKIECSANRPCSTVECPAGFDCTIKCTNANACGGIDCRVATACDITCSGMASCGDITCGAGECAVDCSGPSSCTAVSCVDSCKCDVSCSNAATCPISSCPQVAGGTCSETGMAGAGCDSSFDALCDRCL